MKELMEILGPVLGDELAAAVIEHRKRTLKKPLTAYAARLQAKEYLKTGNPVAAAEMQILRGWQALKADWYLNEMRKQDRNAQRKAGDMADFTRKVMEGFNDLPEPLSPSSH